MKKLRNLLSRSLLYLVLFIFWTAAILLLDVQPIGPNYTRVGFAWLNNAFHRLTGVHLTLYYITDWLSLLPVFIIIFFAGVGLVQWIRRGNILKVDRDILLLGAFYLAVFSAYLFFEEFPVNFRPVLIEGFLEASYPSSTTLLVLTSGHSAVYQIRRRVRNPSIQKLLSRSLTLFSALMVLGRLLAGVHWLTDIIGGVLLSRALTEAYACSLTAFCDQEAR